MNSEVQPAVPGWVWVAVAGLAVGSLAGAAVYAARSPGYERLVARTGAPKELQILAAIQRYTESRGNPKAGLGRPELFPWWAEPSNAAREKQVAESAAAAEGYDRNLATYGESPYPRRMWIFGSGGPYGLLPSSALAPWRGTDEMRRGKVTPYDVFNPWRATVFFVDYVWRLVNRAEFRKMPAAARNVLALKRGLASPALVADFEEESARSRSVRRRAIEAAESLGIDEDKLYQQVPLAWPDYIGAKELVP
ncbi:hypothetical protein [Enhygromyxa salina]|uniref:Uncharacterized protein n=1 Tax=Enhygromyxa salina TaxID=215803 RepID=A0A2S9YAG5_9BACT|nr:hypothetical protein [Enhygromyxa salina]PRQ02052.1 hypothetical protein ENSA7_56250 [Enhygromyxa salina]